MENENLCKYVSSLGILKSCDLFSSTPISCIKQMINYDFTNLVDNSVVYICISAVPFFYKTILAQLTHKIILVTGDGDETCPTDVLTNEELLSLIESDMIIHWFSQNCVELTHSKLSQIPIGLNYHTMARNNHAWGEKISSLNQENMLENIKNKSKPFHERIIKAYSNFHFSMSTKFGYDRIDAVEKINKNLVYYEENIIERKHTWEKQSDYAFVISPHGNGLDCYRTWEALCLGCCPIVKSSALDPLYEDLPVLIIKDWALLTQELLEQTIDEFKNRAFKYDKLTLNYWTNKINSHKPTFNLKNNLIKTKSILISGCCINVERFMKKNLFVMNEIGKQCKEYKIIIFENDSTDKTRQILVDNKTDHCEYIFEDNVNIKNRTERIAYCRNKIIEHIDKMKYYDYDYLLMLDLDDVLFSGKLINTIHTCFNYKPEQWDAMFANSSDKYYDIYALRKKKYLTSCCWNDVNVLKQKGVPHNIAYEQCINKFIINYPTDTSLIPVQSAFGGAGLYKMKSIIGTKYIGYEINHIDKQICEHVTFNKCLIDKGCKLYINPKMLIM